MNKILKSAMALVTLAAAATSCEKGADIFTREQDEVTVSCIEQSIEQNILCSGDWTSRTDSDWITVSPESGSGNGVDYQYYYINVAYNSGGGRSGIVTLTHNGRDYEVIVNQKACDFSLGKVTFDGKLTQGEESTAQVKIEYKNASGSESVSVSGAASGAAAAGLAIKGGTFNSFQKGNGFIVSAVTGTPVNTGEVTFTVSIDGKTAGSCTATVTEKKKDDPVGPITSPAEGFPCGWNFYAAGCTTKDACAATEAGKDWIDDPHHVYPTSGDNAGAFISAVGAAITAYAFNPGIQVQGMMGGDYLLATIPVKNVSPATSITVEGATGGAKSSVGFWVLEYSSNGETWYAADGIQTVTRGTESVQAHFWNTYASINSNGTVCKDGTTGNRTQYDKSNPEETYHSYTFALKNVTIADGNLYLRLRALQYGATQESLVAVKAGWTDIKGFEVSLAN